MYIAHKALKNLLGIILAAFLSNLIVVYEVMHEMAR